MKEQNELEGRKKGKRKSVLAIKRRNDKKRSKCK